MLQLWYKECVSTWLHPCKVRHGRCPPLPPTLRLDAVLKGYELGYFKMATTYRRPIVLALACIRTYRCRAASRATLDPTNDCKVGGDVEGQCQRNYC